MRVASDLARQASAYQSDESTPSLLDGSASLELGKLYSSSKITIAQSQTSTVVVVAVPAARWSVRSWRIDSEAESMATQQKSRETITIVGTRMSVEPLDGPNAAPIGSFK